jgi:hypothetical protein
MQKNRKYKCDKNKLCKILLILTILGILILLLLSLFVKPKEISICNLRELKEEDYVYFSGKIISERNLTEDFTLLVLENSSCKIEITCNCHNFLNKNVSVIGIISYYENKTQINAEKIQIIKNDN